MRDWHGMCRPCTRPSGGSPGPAASKIGARALDSGVRRSDAQRKTRVQRPTMTTLEFSIRRDDLSGSEIRALLAEHLRDMHAQSPPESVHALPLDALRAPEVAFWTMWHGATLLGCGALRELDAAHGEIKSMRTVVVHRRKGVAAALLEHILDEAKKRRYKRVSLETGAMAAFAAAHGLYAKFGFNLCGPFADYVEDPNSIFMTMEL